MSTKTSIIGDGGTDGIEDRVATLEATVARLERQLIMRQGMSITLSTPYWPIPPAMCVGGFAEPRLVEREGCVTRLVCTAP